MVARQNAKGKKMLESAVNIMLSHFSYNLKNYLQLKNELEKKLLRLNPERISATTINIRILSNILNS